MTKQLGYSKIIFLGHEYNKTLTYYNMELQVDDDVSVKFKIAIDEKTNPNLSKKDQVLLANKLIQVLKKGVDV